MDSTRPTGPVNIDAYVFIAWCMHCTIARMSSGSLIPTKEQAKLRPSTICPFTGISITL